MKNCKKQNCKTNGGFKLLQQDQLYNISGGEDRERDVMGSYERVVVAIYLAVRKK